MLFVELNDMPYDKVVNGQFVHATGYALVCEDGLLNLYEDDVDLMHFVDSGNTIREDEYYG